MNPMDGGLEGPSHTSDVLHKLKELNKRITELKNGERKDALVFRNTTISLDYITSNHLSEVEDGIRETIEGVSLSKTALCKALANIDKKKLYKQAGFNSFHRYLLEERIPLNYKTAKEYAKIGLMLIKHEDELSDVDFSEEDGLKKLVYLEKALKIHKDNTQEVYERVKESSLREFKNFVSSGTENHNSDTAIAAVQNDRGNEFRVHDALIFHFDPDGSRQPVLKVNRKAFDDFSDTTFSELMKEIAHLLEYFRKKND